MTTLYEWFDPSNKEHIKAFRSLQKTGVWPKGFVPEHVERGSSWRLVSKIAEYYITKIVNEDERDI